MKKNKYSLSLSLKFLYRVVLMTVLGTSFLCFSAKGDPVPPPAGDFESERGFSFCIISGNKKSDFFQILLQ